MATHKQLIDSMSEKDLLDEAFYHYARAHIYPDGDVLRSIALKFSALAASIALVEAQRDLVAEQRETNRILISMIRIDHGALAAGTVLDNFTQHPRPAREDDAE